MSQEEVIARVERYYSAKVTQHGATPAGVDWNSSASQTLRFEQLLKVCDTAALFSLTDYGCGYGALADYLEQRGVRCTYRGYDVSPAMIEQARRISRPGVAVEFFASPESLRPTTYAVASGIFNRPEGTPPAEWMDYMKATVRQLHELSTDGFAFNVLTSYAAEDKRRPDLHYADPCFWLDHCERHCSRKVALLHDYGLYEFTLIVRR